MQKVLFELLDIKYVIPSQFEQCPVEGRRKPERRRETKHKP